MSTLKKAAALIVAAGTGERFGGQLPKQYQPLGGMPMLRRTVLAFLDHQKIDKIQIVIHHDHRDLYENSIAGLTLPPPVAGGATRQESVRRGLEALAADAPAYVLIHDAARPFVSARLIGAVVEGLENQPALLPVLPVADTLKRVEHGHIAGTTPRAGLFAAQTPQGFHFPLIFEAHQRYQEENLTDDAALIERQGGKVAVLPGEEMNFKITTAEDAARAETMLAARRETRVGQGFDVHRLVAHPPGSREVVRLCGVDIPFEQRLEGHSDADVGIHALVDALLGALGEGDIGMHFPPSDPRWKGADSADFLRHARELAEGIGARIVHVDVTLIGERPKISPHREAMRQALAELLGIGPSRVSVKATTTERLGFTGRGEGLAAQAVATVEMAGEAGAFSLSSLAGRGQG